MTAREEPIAWMADSMVYPGTKVFRSDPPPRTKTVFKWEPLYTRARPLDRDAWRPIESAPKDGTRILLNWGGLVVQGFWLDNSSTAKPWAGWRVGSMEVEPRGHVTHWMPLPQPPTTSTGSGK